MVSPIFPITNAEMKAFVLFVTGKYVAGDVILGYSATGQDYSTIQEW
jgi:hypothetical protein